MGIPADVVAAEFEKRQKKANEVLKANYKRRQMRAVRKRGKCSGRCDLALTPVSARVPRCR